MKYTSNINKRVYDLEYKFITSNNDKWRLKVLIIIYRGDDTDINNKKYYIKTSDIKKYRPNIKVDAEEVIYNNLDDFYKDYNLYPNKDINPLILNIVDNSNLEKAMINEDKKGGI